MKLSDVLRTCAQRQNRLVVLSGAGVSAESGIPTFRGPDGYWTVGSQEYRAQEMATFKMFQIQPDDVWEWYLYRLGMVSVSSGRLPERKSRMLPITLSSD